MIKPLHNTSESRLKLFSDFNRGFVCMCLKAPAGSRLYDSVSPLCRLILATERFLISEICFHRNKLAVCPQAAEHREGGTSVQVEGLANEGGRGVCMGREILRLRNGLFSILHEIFLKKW